MEWLYRAVADTTRRPVEPFVEVCLQAEEEEEEER